MKGERKDAFNKLMDYIEKTSKSYGYTSRREVATFTSGYIKGQGDLLIERSRPKPAQKKKKRGTV